MAGQGLRSRRWPLLIAGWLAWAFVVADGVTAAWSLIAAHRWNWEQFGTVVGPALGGGLGSSVGQLLLRRGVLPSRAKVRRRLKTDQETAQAIRTGTLPPDADPQQWRPQIQRRLRALIGSLLAVAVLCVISAVLTLVSAHLTSHDDRVLWAIAAVALLLTAPPIGLANWARRQGRILLSQL